MPVDKKISLLDLKATPGPSDLLVIVDVADLSMAPSGTDKRTTVGGLVLAESQVTGLTAALAALQPADADLTALAALTHAKGQVIADTGAAWSALAPGADAQVLTLDSTAAAGVKWATPAAGMAIGAAISGGTAGRVPFEGAGPVLADSSSFTYDGDGGLGVVGAAGTTIATAGTCSIGNQANLGAVLNLSSGAFQILTTSLGSPLLGGSIHGLVVTGGVGGNVPALDVSRYADGAAYPVARFTCNSPAHRGVAIVGAAGQSAPLVPLQGISSLPAAKDLGYIDAGFVGGDRTDATYLGFVTISAIGWDGVSREGLRVASTGGGAITTLPGTAVIGTLSGVLKGTSGVVSAAAEGTDYLSGATSKLPLPFSFGGAGANAVGNDLCPRHYVSYADAVARLILSTDANVSGTFTVRVMRSSDGGATFPDTVGTVSLTTGNRSTTTTTITTPSLAAGDWLRLDIAAVAGTVGSWMLRISTLSRNQ